RLPAEFPKSPGVSRRFADQGRFIPAGSSIGAELNSHDFTVTGPSRSMDTHGRVCWNALAFGRPSDFGFRLHRGKRDQFGKIPSPLPERVIEGLVITVKRFVGDDDALEPLDRCHGIPARDDRAERKAVFRWKINIVHLVSEQDV